MEGTAGDIRETILDLSGYADKFILPVLKKISRNESIFRYSLFYNLLGHRFSQRGKAATKQAFNPQITQITQILQVINKNNSKSIGFHDLPSKN